MINNTMNFLVFKQNYPSITEDKYYPVVDIHRDLHTQEVHLFFLADDGIVTVLKDNDKTIDFEWVVESYVNRIVNEEDVYSFD